MRRLSTRRPITFVKGRSPQSDMREDFIYLAKFEVSLDSLVMRDLRLLNEVPLKYQEQEG
jgi:hypothetical protein